MSSESDESDIPIQGRFGTSRFGAADSFEASKKDTAEGKLSRRIGKLAASL